MGHGGVCVINRVVPKNRETPHQFGVDRENEKTYIELHRRIVYARGNNPKRIVTIMGIEMDIEKRSKEFFSTGLKFEQKNHKNINLAYLFGSYAKGRITPMSDVDIAVLLGNEIDPKVYLDIQLELSDHLSSYLDKEVEVVILNRADPRLSYQVIKYGKIVFEKDRNMKADFERKSLNIYFDLKPMFDFYEKKLLERIKEGKFGKTYRGSRNSSSEIRRISEKFKRTPESHSG